MPKKREKVSTSILPGFMELLPSEQILFNRLLETIKRVYENFGFIPLDTPAIERTEVLLAKAGGETEKQIYRFKKGENDLALRFDLTVPLARYVSEHANELNFPFRRYQIAKVYRGERPQKGRYREFYQCDIDIVGRDSLSLMNDAEILAVIYSVLTDLGLPKFQIRISNRKLVQGLLESLRLEKKAVEVMRAIDKADKISEREFEKILYFLGLKEEAASQIKSFIGLKGSPAEVISNLEKLKIKSQIFTTGLTELKEVLEQVRFLGIPDSAYRLDLAIARGLDYYTGTIYETILSDYPGVGSVCSGGRYDSLVENYSEQKFPGVGISIGLTRLFSQLRELGLIETGASSPAQVVVIPFDKSALQAALKIGSQLRKNSVSTEIYFEDGKFKNKLSYVNKSGVRYAVIIGEDEAKGSFFTLKDMESGQQEKLSEQELLRRIAK